MMGITFTPDDGWVEIRPRRAVDTAISQFDLDGNPLRTFESSRDAIHWIHAHESVKAKHLEVPSPPGVISRYGYQWRAGRDLTPLETKGRDYRRTVLRFTDGECDARYNSLSDAARDLRRHGHARAAPQRVHSVISEPLKTAYGHQWRYEDEWDGKPLEIYPPRKDDAKTARRRARRRKAYVKKAVDTRKRPVYRIDPDGGREAFESMSAAARWLIAHGHEKAEYSAIGNAVRTGGTAYGYRWERP